LNTGSTSHRSTGYISCIRDKQPRSTRKRTREREKKEGVVVLPTISKLGGCGVLHRVDVDGVDDDGVEDAVKSGDAVQWPETVAASRRWLRILSDRVRVCQWEQ
jgi:hypothetical protein